MNNLKEQLEQKQQQAKKENRENPNHTKNKVLTLFASRQNNEATEILVGWFKSANKIYTIRDDREPEMWIYKGGIYEPEGKSHITEFVREILGEAYTTYRGNQVISKIQADTFINQNDFFNQNNLDHIAVENGLLNIKTKELQPFDSDKIFFNKIPVKYEPKAKCPKIEQFFADILKYDSDLTLIYEIFGFLLLKDYRIAVAFMLIGNGRNGKSKLLELIKRFLGAYNCTSISLQKLENDRWSKAYLFGKLANLSGDLSKYALKKTGVFKKTTGSDLIDGDRKFKNPIHFVNYAKHIFACNELPYSYDNTRAFWERWIILEFPYTFVSQAELEKNKSNTQLKLRNSQILKDILSETEKSGLLNKALDGLATILKNKKFSISQSVEDTRIMWQRKSNSFNAFCLDKLGADWDHRITKKKLKREYALYCKEHKLQMTSNKTIKAILTNLFQVCEGQDYQTKKRYWEGIKFQTDTIKEIEVDTETIREKQQLEKIEKTHYPCHNCGATPSEYLDKRSDTFFCDDCKAVKK